jgi:hypothetical protein
MSHTGKTDIVCNNQFSGVSSPHPHLLGLAEAALWIRRHREPIEATITISLAMSTPILAAVATLQPSLTA